jgi:hypothetical protein
MWGRQQPLDQPGPAAGIPIEDSLDAERVVGRWVGGVHGLPSFKRRMVATRLKLD